MANPRVLILGAKGNLGAQLEKIFHGAVSWDRQDVDATDFASLREKIGQAAGEIDAVINCVAYNDVDGAETNQQPAMMLNAELPKNLSKICRELDKILIHYSTAYVFSGQKKSYSETDQPDPVSVYGQSKAAGENNVIQKATKYYLIRTNLLFGPKGESELAKPSVVDVMRKRGEETGKLLGIQDEYASFTYTPDLAEATAELLASGRPYGVYHLTNDGYGSWYDLAKEIFAILGYKIFASEEEAAGQGGKKIVIAPVPAAEFKRAAKRPFYSVLENSKLPKLRTWQQALAEYLRNKRLD